MSVEIGRAPGSLRPGAFASFRFLARDLDESGRVTLDYALDDAVRFREQIELPVASPVGDSDRARVDSLLALLHWVAGVSYYKTALPERVSFEAGAPPPAAAQLLEALYSEGLAELAYRNGLPSLPRPAFGSTAPAGTPPREQRVPTRVLVPIGGGKDSIVALETIRRTGLPLTLFSVGDAKPIARTAAVAGLPHLIARRRLDPELARHNREGAVNGHVPVTAIVSCIALLLAALSGFDTVAMANERSASAGNLRWDGVEVNHQFSKGLRVERMFAAALAEIDGAPRLFSVLRPASELAIARAFARMERYHGAFTSCNAVFRLDPELRAGSWCCECPKCRFVYLALAPFSDPGTMRGIFGRDLLDEAGQFEGFALLTATGGSKPFECVGEEDESLAAVRLLAEMPEWRGHSVLERLIAEVLPLHADRGEVQRALALVEDHDVPEPLMGEVRALLGA